MIEQVGDMIVRLPGLTAAPAAVLVALDRAQGRFLSEGQLLEAIEAVTCNRSDGYAAGSAIKRARAALAAHEAGEIISAYNVGWRLVWRKSA